MAIASRNFLVSPTALAAQAQAPLLSVHDGVGVVAIHGPMIRKPDLFSQILFNATDSESILEAVREAESRPDVEAVFLDIDSPGGVVTGTPELAQAVADVGRSKPVYAFSSGLMCSAAYWVGSQAQAVYVTPSARVGSIGVIQPVVDQSEAFKAEGIKVEVFAAGKFKSIGTPGVSLTDVQREHIQSKIEETAQDFHAAVLARGRKIPPEAMEGQDFSGKQAQKLNLAGVVRDRAEALQRLRTYHLATRSTGGANARVVDTVAYAMSKTIEDQLQEALARVQTLEADAQAGSALLTDAAAQSETFKTQLAALTAERDQHATDLSTIRQSVASLTARNQELEGFEQDLEKRAALRAAQIVASTGTTVPAKITPSGDPGVATTLSTKPEELIAQYNDLVKSKDPRAAAEFYQKNIQPLFKS